MEVEGAGGPAPGDPLPRLDTAGLGPGVDGRLVGPARDLRPDESRRLIRGLIRLGTYASDLDAMSADAAIAQMQLAADKRWVGLPARRVEPARRRPPRVGPGRPDRRRVSAVWPPRTRGVSRSRHTDSPSCLSARCGRRGHGWSRLGPGDPGRRPGLARPRTAGHPRMSRPGSLPGPVARLPSSPSTTPSTPTPSRPPPARPPRDGPWSAPLRYGTGHAAEDRAQLDTMVAAAGVRPAGDIVVGRFLPLR